MKIKLELKENLTHIRKEHVDPSTIALNASGVPRITAKVFWHLSELSHPFKGIVLN